MRFKIYYFDEFIVLTFYIKEILSNNARTFAQIIRKIYIVDNLKIEMLIEVDILTSKQIIIDFVIQIISIDSCRGIIVSINSRARLEFIKRVVKSSTRIILSSHSIILVFIVYVDELSTNRDLLFESNYTLFFDYASGVYTHIVNISLKTVQIKNDIDLFVVIFHKTRLDILE